MNNVVLVGRLTRDPELRTTPNGIATTQITVAVNRPVTSATGERQADFINVVVWRRQAENVAKYCSKGSLVGVTGRIQTRSYDAQDGNRRYVTEVVADNVTFLGSRQQGSVSNTNSFSVDAMPDYNTVDSFPEPQISEVTEDPFKDFGSEVVLSDDDLPF